MRLKRFILVFLCILPILFTLIEGHRRGRGGRGAKQLQLSFGDKVLLNLSHKRDNSPKLVFTDLQTRQKFDILFDSLFQTADANNLQAIDQTRINLENWNWNIKNKELSRDRSKLSFNILGSPKGGLYQRQLNQQSPIDIKISLNGKEKVLNYVLTMKKFFDWKPDANYLVGNIRLKSKSEDVQDLQKFIQLFTAPSNEIKIDGQDAEENIEDLIKISLEQNGATAHIVFPKFNETLVHEGSISLSEELGNLTPIRFLRGGTRGQWRDQWRRLDGRGFHRGGYQRRIPRRRLTREQLVRLYYLQQLELRRQQQLGLQRRRQLELQRQQQLQLQRQQQLELLRQHQQQILRQHYFQQLLRQRAIERELRRRQLREYRRRLLQDQRPSYRTQEQRPYYGMQEQY